MTTSKTTSTPKTETPAKEAPAKEKAERTPLERFSCKKYTDVVGTIPGLRRHLLKSKSIKVVPVVDGTSKLPGGITAISEQDFVAALKPATKADEEASKKALRRSKKADEPAKETAPAAS